MSLGSLILKIKCSLTKWLENSQTMYCTSHIFRQVQDENLIAKFDSWKTAYLATLHRCLIYFVVCIVLSISRSNSRHIIYSTIVLIKMLNNIFKAILSLKEYTDHWINEYTCSLFGNITFKTSTWYLNQGRKNFLTFAWSHQENISLSTPFLRDSRTGLPFQFCEVYGACGSLLLSRQTLRLVSWCNPQQRRVVSMSCISFSLILRLRITAPWIYQHYYTTEKWVV